MTTAEELRERLDLKELALDALRSRVRAQRRPAAGAVAAVGGGLRRVRERLRQLRA